MLKIISTTREGGEKGMGIVVEGNSEEIFWWDGGWWLKDSNNQWAEGNFESYTLQSQGHETTEHYGTVIRVYSW
jgi:hypothetical protein